MLALVIEHKQREDYEMYAHNQISHPLCEVSLSEVGSTVIRVYVIMLLPTGYTDMSVAG